MDTEYVPPEGSAITCRTGGDEQRPAGVGLAQQRVHRPSQPPIGREIDCQRLVPNIDIEMGQWRHNAELSGIAKEGV